MEIVFSPKAERQFTKIAEAEQRKIAAMIKQYAENPQSLAAQVKKLKGSADLFRLRVGDYRVIFTRDGVVMLIVKVGHRSDVYD
jgi:mRNA interferase RelE/StbE